MDTACYWCQKLGTVEEYEYDGAIRFMHPRCISWVQGKTHRPKKGEAFYPKRVEKVQPMGTAVPQCICTSGDFNKYCPYNANPPVDLEGAV